MPTIITHPVVPLAIAVALGTRIISPRLALVGAVASIVPDADVLAFKLGIPYANEFGHRGVTHSFGFAFLLGVLAALFASRLRSTPLCVFVFVVVATASHALLDALTNGGLGVATLWPFSGKRFFAAMRVIEVSPIGVSQFFSARGWAVLRSELFWVWLPCWSLAILWFVERRIWQLRSARR